MFCETRRIESATGAAIAYHHEPALQRERGILLICHGLADHSRRYARFAREMARRGYHVYVHDHRGHGETTARDAPLGRFSRRDGAALVLEDLLAIRDTATEAHRALPVILFGHSMGGLVSLNAALTWPDRFDAVGVWNANFHVGSAGRLAQLILLAERMLKGSDVPSGLLPRLTFSAWARAIPNHRTDFDWLSRDPDAVERYIADPLCGFDASVSLWLDVFALTFRAPKMIRRGALPRSMPVHLVGGGKDPATDYGKAVLWLSNHLKRAGILRITTKIYQDMRHETLNEIGAAAAMSDFADWCDEVTAKS